MNDLNEINGRVVYMKNSAFFNYTAMVIFISNAQPLCVTETKRDEERRDETRRDEERRGKESEGTNRKINYCFNVSVMEIE